MTEPAASTARIAQWAVLWNVPGLESRVSVSFSPRLRRSLGRCVPVRGIVRLNPRLLRRGAELLDEVLCHELAHVAAFELHGRQARPHGREWAALMRAAGFEPRVRAPWQDDVDRTEKPPRRVALYEHRCPVCQATSDMGDAVTMFTILRRESWTGGELTGRGACGARAPAGHRVRCAARAPAAPGPSAPPATR